MRGTLTAKILTGNAPFGLLGRHVLGEFLRALALAAGVFTGLFLLMAALPLEADARRYGTDVITLAGVIPYLLPYLLCFSLPLAFLVAAVITFGRLESSGEIAAMRASGVRLTTVLAPVLAFALVTAAPMVLLVDAGLEWGFARARSRVVESGRASLLSRAGAGTTLRVDARGRSYRIHRFGEGPGGARPLCIVEFAAGAPREVLLARDHSLAAESTSEADRLRFDIGAGRDERDFAWARITRPGEVLLARSGEITIASESAAKGRESFLNRPYAHGLSRNVRDARELRKSLAEPDGPDAPDAPARERQAAGLRALEMEIHRKLSFAFAPFALVLLGIPLGLRLARGGALAGFVVGIAVVAVFYYPLWFSGQTLSTAGVLPASVGVWMAQIVAGGVGTAWLSRML